MSQPEDVAQAGPRGRYRSLVRSEAKQVALRQLAEGGPEALSINAIGRELGVSGPALYRYFAGRDELLTALVADAYLELASTVAAADHAGHRSPAQRLRVFAEAYRGWATTEPHRYRLLFAAPLPGYDAQSERLVAASQAAMRVLLDVLAELAPVAAGPRQAEEEATVLDEQLDEWVRRRELPHVRPAVALWAITVWSRLHGLVSLEIEGNFASMGLDAELLFDTEVGAMLTPPTWIPPG